MPNFNYISKFWDKYTYPWRPNKNFIDMIKSFEGNNILILGSTKEFRETFNKKIVTICDLSDSMIKNNNVGNKKEIILNEDWFLLKDGNYDLILGDLILLMFKFKNKLRLIENLLNNLSENGNILIRLVVKKKKDNKIINLVFKKINDYKTYIEFFNYISFELVNGLGMKGDDIYNILNKYSYKLGNIYKNCFLKFTPYNSGGNFCMNLIEFNKILENFNYNIISKEEGIFVDQYILSIKN